jgi:hypothetical protein
MRKSVIRPNDPNQVCCTVACSIAVLLARAKAEGIVVSMVPGKLVKLSRAEEAVSESDIIEC